MIQLYNYELSSSCYKVRLLLNMLELDYEIVPVGFFPAAEHKALDFLSINPLGQLPVLRDNDLLLRDAQAILVYLAARYDEARSWYPTDPKRIGLISMWLSFAGGELMSASAARLHDVLRFPCDIEKTRKEAHAALLVLNDHLTEQAIKGQSWIVGNLPSIADLACFPCVALSHDGGISRDEYPAIERWLDNTMRLPRFIDMPGILRPYLP